MLVPTLVDGAAVGGTAAGSGSRMRSLAMTQTIPLGIKFLLYPVERFRLVLQTKHLAAKGQGIWHIFARPQNASDVMQLWRGFGTTSTRWFVYQQVNFRIKDMLSGVMPKYSRAERPVSYFVSKVMSGAGAGLGAALVWGYPLDVVRQQLATSTAKDSGSWYNTVRDIYRTQGVRGFYRGYLMDAPGLMLFRGVQLGGWDMVKDHYGPAWEEKTRLDRFFHGQSVSLCGSVMAYPWDTWRRNLIRDQDGRRYWDVLRAGADSAGGYRRFFYTGFSVRLLSSVVNGALLEGYDEWKRQCGHA